MKAKKQLISNKEKYVKLLKQLETMNGIQVVTIQTINDINYCILDFKSNPLNAKELLVICDNEYWEDPEYNGILDYFSADIYSAVAYLNAIDKRAPIMFVNNLKELETLITKLNKNPNLFCV